MIVLNLYFITLFELLLCIFHDTVYSDVFTYNFFFIFPGLTFTTRGILSDMGVRR